MTGISASSPTAKGPGSEQRFVSVFMTTLESMEPPVTMPFLYFLKDLLRESRKRVVPGEGIDTALMRGLESMEPSATLPLLDFLNDFLSQAVRRAREEART